MSIVNFNKKYGNPDCKYVDDNGILMEIINDEISVKYCIETLLCNPINSNKFRDIYKCPFYIITKNNWNINVKIEQLKNNTDLYRYYLIIGDLENMVKYIKLRVDPIFSYVINECDNTYIDAIYNAAKSVDNGVPYWLVMRCDPNDTHFIDQVVRLVGVKYFSNTLLLHYAGNMAPKVYDDDDYWEPGCGPSYHTPIFSKLKYILNIILKYKTDWCEVIERQNHETILELLVQSDEKPENIDEYCKFLISLQPNIQNAIINKLYSMPYITCFIDYCPTIINNSDTILYFVKEYLENEKILQSLTGWWLSERRNTHIKYSNKILDIITKLFRDYGANISDETTMLIKDHEILQDILHEEYLVKSAAKI